MVEISAYYLHRVMINLMKTVDVLDGCGKISSVDKMGTELASNIINSKTDLMLIVLYIKSNT